MYKPIQYIDTSKLVSQLKYREYIPDDLSLIEYVACYWNVNSTQKVTNISYRIIPDGCVDIIYDLKDKNVLLFGISDKTMHLNLNGNINYFGIRFLPRAIPFILKHDACISLNSCLDDNITLTKLNEMTDKIFSKINIREIINIVKHYLKIFFYDFSINQKFNTFLEHALYYKGSLSVQKIAAYYSISEKQLGRYFKEYLGISTKPFLKIIRFQHVFQIFSQYKKSHIDLALDSGYYDQSHLVKDLNYFLGDIKNIY